jgi:hypothetical protein
VQNQIKETEPITLQAPGYNSLANVLQRAFNQAAKGKGAERHAQGEPFDQQVMQDGARRFGVGGLLFQAFKKSEESQRLQHDKAVAELLGAINYLAGAVIAMERAAPLVSASGGSGFDLDYYGKKNAAILGGRCSARGVSVLCDECIERPSATCKAVAENDNTPPTCACGLRPAGTCWDGAGCNDG